LRHQGQRCGGHGRLGLAGGESRAAKDMDDHNRAKGAAQTPVEVSGSTA
jgi:hypothetical protein